MSGIYGNSAEDKYFERMLDEHTDSEEYEDEEEKQRQADEWEQLEEREK